MNFTNGYLLGHREGLRAARDEFERELSDLALQTAQMHLHAALRIIQAYGEDGGYTPRRVADEMALLESAGLLK